MIDERRENAFTEEDRKVLKDVRAQVRAINGTVTRHDEEIFGDPSRQVVGSKKSIEELNRLALQVKTAVRVIVALVAVVGITNILILFRTAGG